MKKKPVWSIKKSLAILGFLCISLGSFTEFQSMCDHLEKGGKIVDTINLSIRGINSPLWYLFAGASILIFCIGYFSISSVNRTFIYIISILLSLYIAFVTWLSQAAWGGLCGKKPSYGYYLSLLGSLFVLTATIISMHRKKTAFTDHL